MKDLTWQEISLVNGANQQNNTLAEEQTPSWDQLKLDQRQWSTLAGMAVHALISHTLPNGPAKSVINIAGFACISVVCNTIFSML